MPVTKAIVCRTFAPVEQLQYENFEQSALAGGEVRVAIRAAGVNFPDALKVEGCYQVKPELPWIPGSEMAGVVIEAAPDVSTMKVGDRVMGLSLNGGGYAQQIVLPEERALILPRSVNFDEAAVLPIVYGTSLYALRHRARLQAGESLLVLGAAGGTGLAAVQLGKTLGAYVIAAASTPEKRELALQHGASHAIDYSRSEWRHEVKSLTEGRGVDVVYDPVGGDVFDQAVRTIGWGGRYLIVGFTAGRIPTLQTNMPLVKGFDILGVRHDTWRNGWWCEARADLEQVLAWCAAGEFKPFVSARYPLHRAVEAMRSVTDRRSIGKVVLENRDEDTKQ